MRRLDDLIYVGQIAELQNIVHGDDWIEIGAGVTVEKAGMWRWPASIRN